MIPGEMFIKDGEIELNAGRKTVTLTVANSRKRAACGSTSPPALQCGSSRGRRETCSSWRLRVSAWSMAFEAM